MTTLKAALVAYLSGAESLVDQYDREHPSVRERGVGDVPTKMDGRDETIASLLETLNQIRGMLSFCDAGAQQEMLAKIANVYETKGVKRWLGESIGIDR